MKKTLLLLLTMFFLNNSQAQDTIIKLSGDTIVAKIFEITATEIKYNRFNIQDGPSYIESKSTIRMIKFGNGVTEVFNRESSNIAANLAANDTTKTSMNSNKINSLGMRYQQNGHFISEKEMHEVLLLESNNKQVIHLVESAQKAKKTQYVGFAAIPFGLLFLGSLFPTMLSDDKALFGSITAVLGASTIACPVISIISTTKKNKYNRQAVKIYNEKF